MTADGGWFTPVELAFSLPLGLDAGVARVRPAEGVHPRAALESVVRQALCRPPCLVAFSGGRDSSTVLAVASNVARREGLAAPIPVTHRFPHVVTSFESEHQEAVISSLGIDDWVKLEWLDEMDVVGPIAREAARIAGVGPPVNSHFLLPLIKRGQGGSVLTGNGGDQLFDLRERHAAYLARYSMRDVRVRHLRGVASGVLPRPVRRWRQVRHSALPDYQWFTPAGRADLRRQWAEWITRAPLRYDLAVRDWHWRSRVIQVPLARTGAIAEHFGVEMVHPFETPEFLGAFASWFGAAGPAGRSRALRGIVGDLVPESIISRRTKAAFNDAFVTPTARRAATEWDGFGVDERVVDVHGLRREWSSDSPWPQSLSLLQSVTFRGEEGEDAVDHRPD